MRTKLNLKVITPLFIGCKEKFSTIDYFIKKDYVYFIDFNKFIDIYIKEKNIDIYIKEKNIDNYKKGCKELANFIKDNINNNKFTGKKELYNNEIINKVIETNSYLYKVKANIKNETEINAFIKTNNKPFVPGSSIKGALRTIVLNNLTNIDEFYNIFNNFKFNRKNINSKLNEYLEKLLLIKINNGKVDKFKYIGFSDFIGANDSDLEIKNVERINLAGNIIKAEVLKPGTILSGEIRIGNTLFNYDSLKEMSNKYVLEYLKFIKKRFEKELNQNMINKLINTIEGSDNWFLLLGAYSGWFAKTVHNIYHNKEFNELRKYLRIGKNPRANKLTKIFPKTLGLINGEIAGLVEIYKDD